MALSDVDTKIMTAIAEKVCAATGTSWLVCRGLEWSNSETARPRTIVTVALRAAGYSWHSIGDFMLRKHPAVIERVNQWASLMTGLKDATSVFERAGIDILTPKMIELFWERRGPAQKRVYATKARRQLDKDANKNSGSLRDRVRAEREEL